MTARGAPSPSAHDRRQREQLLAAAGAVSRALLGGERVQAVLRMIATETLLATAAALALVCSATDGDLLVVDTAAGPDSDRLVGRSVRLPTTGTRERHDPAGDRAELAITDPSSLALPLGSRPDGADRVLVVLGLPAAGRDTATRALHAFAEHAADSLGRAHERLAGERERLLQDREHTASGLQEQVIPHLFSASLSLAGADGLLHAQPDQARARLRQALRDLDEAMVQVRMVALGLRTAPAGPDESPAAVPAWDDRRERGQPNGVSIALDSMGVASGAPGSRS